jgi:hypothetical protein
MPTPTEDKSAAIAAVEKTIEALSKVLAELRELEKAVAASPPDLVSVTRRQGEVNAELFDQRALVAHLRAETVRVNPMSQEARDALSGLLAQLDTFVRADQAFHARLDLVEQIVGLAKDHSGQIRGLMT